MNEKIIINEREVAMNILLDILSEGAYNNIALRKTLNRHNVLTNNQKGFITEIVNGTLRNLILIDYYINYISNTKTNKMKQIILTILRQSVYQILFMDRVPHSAVCNEAVALTKKKGFKSLSGFVNGVLRNIIRNLDNIKLPDEGLNPIENISVKYSCPVWLIKYWLEEFDIETVKEICKASIASPQITICTNTIKTTKEKLKEVLKAENIEAHYGVTENAISIKNSGSITGLDSFKEGLYHVMDESSMLAVKALDLRPNTKVLDVCAAPGGKSFFAAYLMENKGEIYSCDIHDHKLDLILEGCGRLSTSIIKVEKNDATIIDNLKNGKFDYVIIDAPCSGFGLLRKKPDIKFTKSEDDILTLANLQKEILNVCSNYVKPGGTLVYCTCTISKKENMDNANWFCENFPFEFSSIENIPKGINKQQQAYLRIIPNTLQTENNMDGFFIAKFKRKD